MALKHQAGRRPPVAAGLEVEDRRIDELEVEDRRIDDLEVEVHRIGELEVRRIDQLEAEVRRIDEAEGVLEGQAEEARRQTYLAVNQEVLTDQVGAETPKRLEGII